MTQPINYTRDVEPLENEGKTDAEIASLLNASTVKDIPIADLENFFTFEGLANRNAVTGAWEGPLIDELNNNVYGLGPGLKKLFEHINKSRSVIIDTTVSPWAEDAWLLTGGLLLAGLVTQAQYDGFYALGKGRKFGDVVEADVAQARADHQAWLLRDAAVNQVMTKAGAAQSAAHSAMEQKKTPAEILVDAEAAWSAG